MNEDKMINQEPISQPTTSQPEAGRETIETNATQAPQVDAQPPAPATEPIVSQGLKFSRGIYWTAIIVLTLSLVALGIYLLQQ